LEMFTPQHAYAGETWPRAYEKWPEGESWPQADSEWLNLPWCHSAFLNKSSMGWSNCCQNLDADSDASTAVGTEASLTSWNIVWCSERCYKAENDERRKRLAELAQSAGASLVLLKKSQKFAYWLAKAQRPPYILLTDWREAKPSLQVTAQEPVHNQPVFTLVLCDEDQKAYERAAQWKEDLPPRADPVHVIREGGVAVLGQFLDNLGERSPSIEESLRSFGKTDGHDRSNVSSPRSSEEGTHRSPLVVDLVDRFVGQGITNQQDASPASCSESSCEDDPMAAQKETRMSQNSRISSNMRFAGIERIDEEVSWLEVLQNSTIPQVSNLLASAVLHQTAAEVAALLRAAQPEAYED